MSKFEVVRGVEGCCLALDDTRIAGPKPWGGGTVIHAWETDKEYKAVDAHTAEFEVENAKLRELVRDMWSAFCFVMEGGIMTRDPGNSLEQRIRELGIEVTS